MLSIKWLFCGLYGQGKTNLHSTMLSIKWLFCGLYGQGKTNLHSTMLSIKCGTDNMKTYCPHIYIPLCYLLNVFEGEGDLID